MKFSFVLTIGSCWTYSIAQQQQQESIWQIIQDIQRNANELRFFSESVQKFPELRDVLAGNSTMYSGETVSNISVFAPVDYAFDRLPQALRVVLINQTRIIDVGGGRRIEVPNVGQDRTANQVLQGLLSYHVINSAINLQSNQTQQQAMMNQTLSTLLSPFNATVWISPEKQRAGQYPDSQIPNFNPNQITQSTRATSFNVTAGSYINEANVTSIGFQGKNGYLYLIDGVVSPLWFLNVSLSELPTLQIPQLIRIMQGV